MLKMYHRQVYSGSSPDFWEATWAASKFEESVRFCATDPLRPLFEKYLRRDSLVLEGGCGIGNYAAYYSNRGYNIIGLDFAPEALRALHLRQPALKLCGGDVSRLPFGDETFDLYYSGGVVEHFESGAEESLAEARRVLKKDGTLLVSVPYFNPLRRLMVPFRKKEWRRVERAGLEEAAIEGLSFFQYAYTVPEFSGLLSQAGLEMISSQGYSVLWGIQDLPLMNQNGKNEFPASRTSGTKVEPAAVNVGSIGFDERPSFLKRLAVSEDHSVPVLGQFVKLLRWSVGNMMMYVCRRKQ